MFTQEQLQTVNNKSNIQFEKKQLKKQKSSEKARQKRFPIPVKRNILIGGNIKLIDGQLVSPKVRWSMEFYYRTT